MEAFGSGGGLAAAPRFAEVLELPVYPSLFPVLCSFQDPITAHSL